MSRSFVLLLYEGTCAGKRCGASALLAMHSQVGQSCVFQGQFMFTKACLYATFTLPCIRFLARPRYMVRCLHYKKKKMNEQVRLIWHTPSHAKVAVLLLFPTWVQAYESFFSATEITIYLPQGCARLLSPSDNGCWSRKLFIPSLIVFWDNFPSRLIISARNRVIAPVKGNELLEPSKEARKRSLSFLMGTYY